MQSRAVRIHIILDMSLHASLKKHWPKTGRPGFCAGREGERDTERARESVSERETEKRRETESNQTKKAIIIARRIPPISAERTPSHIVVYLLCTLSSYRRPRDHVPKDENTSSNRARLARPNTEHRYRHRE